MSHKIFEVIILTNEENYITKQSSRTPKKYKTRK